MCAWAVDRRLRGDAVVVVGDLVLLSDQGSVEQNERLARSAVQDARRERARRSKQPEARR